MYMDNKNIKRAILVDTAALSEAAFDIIVNFERMLNRRIPDVDIKRWLYAAACDGKFVVSDEEVCGASERKGKAFISQFEL